MQTQVHPLPSEDLARIALVDPVTLVLQKYVVRDLGSAEIEEAAARILDVSARLGWTGAETGEITRIHSLEWASKSDPDAPLIWGTSLLLGMSILAQGILLLQERGLIRIEREGIEMVLYPTAALILHAAGIEPLPPA